MAIALQQAAETESAYQNDLAYIHDLGLRRVCPEQGEGSAAKAAEMFRSIGFRVRLTRSYGDYHASRKSDRYLGPQGLMKGVPEAIRPARFRPAMGSGVDQDDEGEVGDGGFISIPHRSVVPG